MKFNKSQNPLTSLYTRFNISKTHRKDMNLVIFTFSSFMVFFPITTGAPISGFANLLGASDFFYSVLIALPVLGNTLQIFASLILEKTKKRKSLFILCGIISRSMWILIGLVPMLFLSVEGSNGIYLILFLLLISSVTSSIIGVGFLSWMGDLIPKKMMGRFFGLRESIGTIVGLLTSLLISFYLDNHTSFGSFAIVFAVAGIAGTIDILGFIWISDIPMKDDPHPKLSIFIKTALQNKSFVHYITFWALWSFSFNLSAAFYNLYALSSLRLSFVQVAIAGQIAYSFVSSIVAPRWGTTLDKHGTRYVLMRAGIFSSLIPLILLFSVEKNMIPYLIFSLLNGLSLTAVNTTSQTMIMSSTPDKNRTMYIALYSAITSVFSIVGYLLGGAFLELLGDITINLSLFSLDRYKILFSFAGILRFLIVLFLVPVMTKFMKDN